MKILSVLHDWAESNFKNEATPGDVAFVSTPLQLGGEKVSEHSSFFALLL